MLIIFIINSSQNRGKSKVSDVFLLRIFLDILPADVITVMSVREPFFLIFLSVFVVMVLAGYSPSPWYTFNGPLVYTHYHSSHRSNNKAVSVRESDNISSIYVLS